MHGTLKAPVSPPLLASPKPRTVTGLSAESESGCTSGGAQSAWIQGCQSLGSLLQAACRVGFSGDVTSGSLVLLKRTGLELEYLGMALGSSVGSLYVSGGSDFPSLASSHHR